MNYCTCLDGRGRPPLNNAHRTQNVNDRSPRSAATEQRLELQQETGEDLGWGFGLGPEKCLQSKH